MKRNYQGYSGSGPTNQNPPPSISYPPLPSGPPPPQPVPASAPQSAQNIPQYQPSSSSVQQTPTSQSYQYNPHQFAAASAAPYGQYPGYPPQQQAAAYPAPQQQPQQQQQQQQQQQHPAYANYGYGAPAGPQQPPKLAQSYQPYPHGPNPTQLLSTPTNQYSNSHNPNIPPNPYTGYTPGQVSAPTLQSSPGSAAPPPYKRPRNNNPLNPPSATTMRIGSNTNNTRGGFPAASRPPRASAGPFGNNSPIRLNLGSAAAAYDGGAPAHYDSGHQHPAQPMAHPLPPHHQSPHANPGVAHYSQNASSFNSAPNNMSPANPADHHYTTHPPAHHNPNYSSANDLNNSSLNAHQRGQNDGGMRGANFAHNDFPPGPAAVGSGFGSGQPPNHNEHFGFHEDSRPGHMGGSTRSGRGGYRGGGGGSAPGGRMSRERGSDYGGEGMSLRGGRGYSSHAYGGSARGDRHGSGSRGRGGSGAANRSFEDHSSSYSAGGPSRHTDRPGGPASRGRNAANLPPLAAGMNKAGHHHDRRGGPGGNARYSSSTGGGMGSSRGGRRLNGRESKFDEHKNPHRPGRGGSGAGSLTGAGGERGERGRHGAGAGGNRVKNGWGSGFKEFNERELKDKDKGDEAPTKRTLTDFRINALEIADVSWQWMADNADGLVDMTLSGIGSSTIAGDEASKAATVRPTVEPLRPMVEPLRPTVEPLVNRTGKHGRDEDEGQPEGNVGSMGAVDASAVNVGGSKKAKSEGTVEAVSTVTVEGTKKVQSEGTEEAVDTSAVTVVESKVKPEGRVELAKKIDEEAASAVKGLNLTVDDQSSELEDSKVDDEVKNQLLSAQPAPTQAVAAADGAQAGVPEVLETKPNVLETPAGQEAVTENGPASTSIAPQAPAAAPEPAVATAPPPRDRAHAVYAKPAIPTGRENSRLRLYFSSPTTDPVVVTNPVGLPTKPLASGSGAKRKLSVSGHSAMSADTKLAGLKPNATETRKAGASEGPAKEQAKVVEPSATAVTTAAVAGRGTEGEGQQTAGKEKSGSGAEEAQQPIIQTDVKTVREHVTTKTTGEEVVGVVPEEVKPTEGYDEDADADGDYEVESHEGSALSYEEAPVPEPQADRLSISYARNTRRIVIDADVVESLRVFRGEHRVEVLVNLLPAVIQGGKYDGELDEYRVCKGVLVESLDQEIDDYVIIDRATLEATWKTEEKAKGKEKARSGCEAGAEGSGRKTNGQQSGAEEEAEFEEGCLHDPLLPPLHRLLDLSLQEAGEAPEGTEKTIEMKTGGKFKQGQVLIVAKLDTVNPLTEAKWIRTGDVDSWISQMTGRIFKPGEEHSDCGWRRKISVIDPDPAPTIQHLLDTWLTTSAVGTIETRQRFIDRHVAKNVDVIIEILLRVVRSSSSPTSSSTSNVHHHPMPLIVQQAATLHAPYPEQQTQISLAVLGMYRLAIEMALEGGIPIEKVLKKATDIVRSLPYRLAFGALDGIYKDEM